MDEVSAPAPGVGALARRLLDLGLVTARDVHTSGMRAWDASRSNPVAVVTVGDGRGYVVKSLATREEASQGTPEQELAAYALAARHQELRHRLPRLRHGGMDDVLVLDLVPHTETAAERAHRTGWSDGRLAAELGAALGGWHHASRPWRHEQPVAPAPWVLGALGPDRPEFLDTNVPVRQVLDDLRGGPLPHLLDGLAATWQPAVVAHGDLQLDNVLIDAGGTVTFVDWEFAGRGDPAWDVGTIAQELVSRSPAKDAASCAPVLGGAVRILLSAYAAACPGTGAQPDFAGRVLGHLAARLLHRALQLASRGDAGLAAERDRHLAIAAAVAGPDGVALVPAMTGRAAA